MQEEAEVDHELDQRRDADDPPDGGGASRPVATAAKGMAVSTAASAKPMP